MLRHLLMSFKHLSLIAVGGVCLPAATLWADAIPAFKLEYPSFYVEAGLEWNPAVGPHPFLLPVPAFWGTPATLTFSGSSVGIAGTSTHLIALHPPEVAPATTWTYSISSAIPSGFGATETRIRRSVSHLSGPHVDAYMAVVGAIVGTAPGAPVGPNLVMIGGSIGKHMDSPPPPAPQPMYGGATLRPRSGQPSPGTLDYPAGELLTIVEPALSRLSMLIVVNGLHGSALSNVNVHQGLNGPILMDLRPQMQLQTMGQYDSALVISDAVVPLSVAQAIAAGNAFISVRFPPMLHPDGEIVGQIGQVLCRVGDIDCDGSVGVNDLLIVINTWGPCPPPCPPFCPGDVDHNCTVNVNDLLVVLNNWG